MKALDAWRWALGGAGWRAALASLLIGKQGPGRPAQPRGPHGLPSYLFSLRGPRTRSFVPLDPETNFKLYTEMRRAFPVLDVAITKLVRLCGEVQIEARETVKADLEAWLGAVRVNATGRGLHTWLTIHLDQMMQFGKAVGEIVPNRSRTEIYALTNLDPRGIQFRPAAGNALALEVVQWQQGKPVVIPEPYVLTAIHNAQGDNPHGVSLYRSLPLVAEALSVIENATVQVWQRQGAPPYHVNWQPPAGFQDPDGSLTAQFMEQIKSAFTEAMAAREAGTVNDFFSSGAVSVDLVGNKNAMFDIQQPFRAFAEQVIAATGLPSWMFGFNWSATETLSIQQADLIVANIAALRRTVQPGLEKLIELRQKLAGKGGIEGLKWSEVNLRDLTEQARAKAWSQIGQYRQIENARRMWELGFWDQLRAAQHADETLTAVATPYPTPPGTAAPQLNVSIPGQAGKAAADPTDPARHSHNGR